MAAPAAGVKVRMYRQGLGDCFLLAFPTRGPRPCYVLIDCGVRLGLDVREAMVRMVASLDEATGGRIDVLVAIREHWDYVSGFQQAKEAFDRIEIGQVWAPWTEDPNDPAAQRLRARRETAVRALHAAAEELRQCGEEESAGSLESVLGWFGEIGKDGLPASLHQTMAYVLGRGHPPRYLRPGDRPELPGVEGARVSVLGPSGAAQGAARDGDGRRRAEEPGLPVRSLFSCSRGRGAAGPVLPGQLLRRPRPAQRARDGMAADRNRMADLRQAGSPGRRQRQQPRNGPGPGAGAQRQGAAVRHRYPGGRLLAHRRGRPPRSTSRSFCTTRSRQGIRRARTRTTWS